MFVTSCSGSGNNSARLTLRMKTSNENIGSSSGDQQDLSDNTDPYRFSSTSSDFVTDAEACFARHGFVVIEQCVEDPHEMCQWGEFVNKWFDFIFDTLHRNNHTTTLSHQNPKSPHKYALGLGAKHGFSEIVMRSPGRYELSLNGFYGIGHHHQNHQYKDELPEIVLVRPPQSWRHVVESTILSTLVPSLLGQPNIDNLKLCHVSLLVATPGSTEQGWHTDGGHVSLSEHLPCHVLNVFLPLDDVPLERGPTEFRPGTHYHSRNLGPMMLAAKCRKTLLPPYCATVQRGDALIFDYRVLHRGKANVSLENRNFLVLTFAHEWFEDIVNFPKRSIMERDSSSRNE